MNLTTTNTKAIRILCVFLVFTAAAAALAAAYPAEPILKNPDLQQKRDPLLQQDHSNWKLFTDSATQYLSELPAIVIDHSKGILAVPDYQFALLLAAGGSIAMHSSGADNRIADHFDKHKSLHREVDELGYYLGSPAVHLGLAGIYYAAAAGENDIVKRENAWMMIEALSVTGVTTLALKFMRDNDTPNGKRFAWPSGHTSSSFTVAAVLDEIYGPQIGIPAYAGAAFVGYRMMDSGDHWASDVLFGAVLGYIVGHHVAGKHKDLEIAGFQIIPYADTNQNSAKIGISFYKKF